MVKAKTIGSLNPNQFGGLEYEDLDGSMANAIIIKTIDYGKVSIYIGPDVSQWFKVVKK